MREIEQLAALLPQMEEALGEACAAVDRANAAVLDALDPEQIARRRAEAAAAALEEVRACKSLKRFVTLDFLP